MPITSSDAKGSELTPAEQQLQEKLQNNKSAAITANAKGLLITIDPDKLDNTDIPLLKDMFTCLLNDKCTTPLAIKLDFSFPFILTRGDFSTYKKYKMKNMSFDMDRLNKTIAHYPVLFKSFLTTLATEKINLDIDYWHSAFEEEMLDELRNEKKSDKYSEKLTNYLSAIQFFYETSSNNTDILDDLLYKVLTMLAEKNQVSGIKFLFNDPVYRPALLRAIQKNDNVLLFNAVNFDNDSFTTLVECLGQDINLTNKYALGFTLLHVCNIDRNLKTALALTKDINAINDNGETPLHKAINRGNISKLHFLLMNGADDKIKNNEGKTIWDLESSDQSLKLYNLYKKYGTALKLPPKIFKQQGLNCAFYAISCAVEHLRSWQPSLFKKEAIPPRKRDVIPKASTSLRKSRHEVDIPGKGAVFSVKELQRVIDKTECGSVVIDVDNQEQFFKIIKKSLEQNLSIIIPFSSSRENPGEPAEKPVGETAHWATIIGFAQNENMTGLLVAQYGRYFDIKGDEMYHAFYDIESTFPERYISKEKGKDWSLHDKPVQPSENVKAETIPLTSLENFRRKLVIVTPPNFDLSQLDLEVKTSKLSIDKKE